ncbi:hypothetical protein ATO12_03680 [Aquimarina atlantica]|uniref:Uncharacterized protein n=1 Tax=Aquimarina atlantica TaxID=1317122 RepID=A0A023C1V8_9FLAO|nr:hypothetical protein [Aquimarina atlantica]EZH75903.1 hypothetical protein ATO12_03680 [Aquimarina atlantica]
MNNFNTQIENTLFSLLPLKKINEDLINDFQDIYKQTELGKYIVIAGNYVSQSEDDLREFEIDTNESLDIVWYKIRVNEIDSQNTDIDILVTFDKSHKEDYFEGLEKCCYFHVSYQILNGEKVNLIEYEVVYGPA